MSESSKATWLKWLGVAATGGYLVLAAIALAWGAWSRFRLPQAPVVDPDIQGYLGPAIFALTGHQFVHLDGRSSAYPAFVYLILRVFGDFRAISIIQHIIGVGAGAVTLMAWNAMLRLVPAGGVPRELGRFAGLAPAVIYLGSSTAIHFEQQIRPEAIFPFLAIVDIMLGFLFIEARFLKRKESAIWLGGLNVFVAYLIYQLKPSFGLATVLSTAPVWVSLVTPGATMRARGMLLAAAVLPAALLLYLPEKVMKAGDPMARFFLPETLFSIHGSLILSQITRDLDSNAQTPYPRPVLQAAHDLLKTDLEKAANASGKSFPILGYNPDYLMYSSFCLEFPRMMHWKAEELLGFYNYYYRRTAVRQPGAMWRKVMGQMGVFYNNKSGVYRLGQSYNMGDEYAQTPGWMLEIGDIAGSYAPMERYFQECNGLAKQGVAITETKRFLEWTRALSVNYMNLLFVVLVSPLVLIARPMRLHFVWLVAAMWVVYGYNFGNCLTVAVVHSLEVMRYMRSQLIYTVFAQCMAGYFVAEVIAVAGRRLRAGKFRG